MKLLCVCVGFNSGLGLWSLLDVGLDSGLMFFGLGYLSGF